MMSVRVTAAAAMLVLPAFSAAAPSASAAGVPLLAGVYAYSSNTFCQMGVIAKYSSSSAVKGTPFVVGISTSTGDNTVSLGAGTLSFTQTGADAGKATISGWEADGSPILVTSTGAAKGTEGATLQGEAQSGSATFQQTATTLKLTEGTKVSTYHIFYGKVSGGIAQFATFVGIDDKGCAERYTLTHG